MKITEIFEKQERTFSFEFFPPKDEISAVEFGVNAGQLMKLKPSFISVTYGAGGSTQERTFNLVDLFRNELGIPTMAHYTCVNATREKIKKDMDFLYEHKIKNLMLLRGDPPKGQDEFIPTDGFNHASDLIKFVKKQNRFCIGAAAYAEKHVEAPNLEEDIRNLKTKVDAGAEFLVTQMFFINDHYFNFVEKARKAGIQCRIIPGIIPITNFKQISLFAKMSGAHIPEDLVDQMKPHADNNKKIYQIGLDFAIKQATELLKRGAPGLHIYTLNKSRASVELFESLSSDFKDVRSKYEESFSPHPISEKRVKN